jgi:[protein-PII] uridylyltransferase
MVNPDPLLIDLDDLTGATQASSPLAPVLRKALSQGDATLHERFARGVNPSLLVHQRAWLVDQILKQAWTRLVGPHHELALLAVGGYGRGELHPGSDVDVLILLKQGSAEDWRGPIEHFVTVLWDIGLQVGHSVRNIDECAEQATRDITIATSLMEARLLWGDGHMFEALAAAVSPANVWPSARFFEAKLHEQIRRHRKFHDALSNLEPHVKEGPGGLRDIQTIAWVAKRHFGASTLHDLVRHGFLTESEYQTLAAGQDFLWKVRWGLHTLAKRREDRLLFHHQKALAELFGYQPTQNRLPVEHFMKDYYVTVTELSRLNEMLLHLFQEAILHASDNPQPTPLNRRFRVRRGFIETVDDRVFQRYPFALLEIFLLLQQNADIHGVSAATIRLIRDHRHLINDRFRNDMRNRSLFMEILREPRGVTHELRRMNRYGILAAYIPAFGKVVGLMQYDLFHVYTVDEHSLMVLRNLRRFTVAEFAHEVPFCSKLITQIPKPELLYLAGLFHDIAKGRGGDHSKLGAEEAFNFCLQHGLSNYDSRLVAWLVRQHLLMSSTAQRQDTSDPEVVATFAQVVGDQTHLDYLYLLTVADIRGTNPALWNSWKDVLLMSLYSATRRVFRRAVGEPINRFQRISEVQTRARAYLSDAGLSDKDIDQIWHGLSDEYFLRHSAEEACWHTEAIATNTEPLPLVLVRDDTGRGASAIFVYTQDQDYLFAAATGTLSQLGLDILDARIMTTDTGQVLDTFTVLDAAGQPLQDAFQIRDIERRLHDALSNPSKQNVLAPRPIPRRLKAFTVPAEVTFSTDFVDKVTVMDLVATDRPGLLAMVGRALAECEVRLNSAKIATFGERVEDVFFITDRQRRPLRDEVQFACLRNRIKELLEEEHSA